MNEGLQRSEAWYDERCGSLTGSIFADVFARSKRDGKPLKAYYDLIDRLIAERATGIPTWTPTTAAMQWGIDHEDEARDLYEAETGSIVEPVGFVPHPDVLWLGASPDGLIGTDGILEIKCPATTTHLRRIKAGVVPEEYKPQMLLEMLCTGRKWADYVDYDPRLTGRFEHLRLWTIRYEPTAEELQAALDAACEFLAIVDDEVQAMLIKPNQESKE